MSVKFFSWVIIRNIFAVLWTFKGLGIFYLSLPWLLTVSFVSALWVVPLPVPRNSCCGLGASLFFMVKGLCWPRAELIPPQEPPSRCVRPLLPSGDEFRVLQVAGLVFFNHVFSLVAFKMPPNGDLVVSCCFGAGGQSHPPAVGLEVGDLGRAGSDAVTAPCLSFRTRGL